jgi:cytochrome c peroxidase
LVAAGFSLRLHRLESLCYQLTAKWYKTLKEVVMFNNTRDVPGANWPPPEVPENVHRHMPPMPKTFGQLGLTNQEIDDIVAFLETLTDGYKLTNP